MSPSRAPEGAEIFVGRGRELGELDGVRRRAVTGHGELVLLAGEAGVGKTRLVEEVADRWEAEGFRVAWATCWQGGPVPPFWPWAQLLEKVTGSAAIVLDDDAAEGSTIGRRGRRSDGVGSEGLARFAEAASVLAPAFGADALSEVVGGEVGDVAAHADEAVAAHVFEAIGFGRYGFTHGLFRDALYDELGEARRANFHSRVGQALERLRERGQPIDASAVGHRRPSPAPTPSGRRPQSWRVRRAPVPHNPRGRWRSCGPGASEPGAD